MKKLQLPTKTKGRTPSSRSNRAPEKKNEKNPVAKPEKRVGECMLARHLTLTTPVNTTDPAAQLSSQFQSWSLYCELEPRDSAEAILAAMTVAVTNASMNCLRRAERCDDSLAARDVNLRHGLKGALVARDLLSARDSLRGLKPKGLTVGEVNVGSGGQAIVGHVESGRRRERSASSGVSRCRQNSKAKR